MWARLRDKLADDWLRLVADDWSRLKDKLEDDWFKPLVLIGVFGVLAVIVFVVVIAMF